MRYRHGNAIKGTVTGARPKAGTLFVKVRNKTGAIVAEARASSDGGFRVLVPKEAGVGPFTIHAQQGRRPGPRDLGVVKDVFISEQTVTIPLGNQRD